MAFLPSGYSYEIYLSDLYLRYITNPTIGSLYLSSISLPPFGGCTVFLHHNKSAESCARPHPAATKCCPRKMTELYSSPVAPLYEQLHSYSSLLYLNFRNTAQSARSTKIKLVNRERIRFLSAHKCCQNLRIVTVPGHGQSYNLKILFGGNRR